MMCMISNIYTHITQEAAMRTNIVIDDRLMSEALMISGCKTKKEAVEQALKLLIIMKKQEKIRELRGKLSWEGVNYKQWKTSIMFFKAQREYISSLVNRA